MRIVVLDSSPRRDGNSRLLSQALTAGAAAAGHVVEQVDLNTIVDGFLRDCRTCRAADGACSVDDGFGRLVHDSLVPADGVVLATPLHFYGMTAVLKAALDRLVCYVAAGYPGSGEVVQGLAGQRWALLVSSEEQNPALLTSLVLQVTALTGYFHQDFVGVVNGVGNARGDVRRDPADPLAAAAALGAELFTRRTSDYVVDDERASSVWST